MRDWTLRSGERQVGDGHIESISQDHVARYQFALNRIRDSFGDSPIRVLDIFCGVGYGSRLIAESIPANVVAVDGSREALDHAEIHYSHHRVEYLQSMFGTGDHQAFPYYWDGFDAIVCLESLEHVEDPAALLRFLSDVAHPFSLIILSTPNETHQPFKQETWPHHYRHFTDSQLTQLLSDSLEGFAIIDWRGQDRSGTIVPERSAFHLVTLERGME